MTSKNPEGLLLCGSLIGARSLHALDVDRVVIDGVAHGEEERAASHERRGAARRPMRKPAIAAPAERRVERARQPQEAIARRRGEQLPLDGGDGRAIEVLEQLLRGLDQARRVGARGQPAVGAAAHERQILDELVQALVERGLGVGDARRRAGEEAIVDAEVASTSRGAGATPWPHRPSARRSVERNVSRLASEAELAQERAEQEVLLRRIGVVDLVVVEVALEGGVVLGEQPPDDVELFDRVGDERDAVAARLRHDPAEQRRALAEHARRGRRGRAGASVSSWRRCSALRSCSVASRARRRPSSAEGTTKPNGSSSGLTVRSGSSFSSGSWPSAASRASSPTRMRGRAKPPP